MGGLLSFRCESLYIHGHCHSVVNNSRTRAAKARAQEEYSEATHKVKRSIRADKRAYIDNLAAEPEQAAAIWNSSMTFPEYWRGKNSHTERPLKDKEGKSIVDRAGQLKRWAEHFEELLNRPTPPDIPDIQPAETDLPISCDRPNRE